ncbi:Hypothetical Protein SiL_0876 [Sulfolobus islandicus LAL14/1]|uniref:Uncharacterized protein n=1 Tax=Saccharolobus islandicus LAL14/1 TaxID=1241935 RepID=M9UDR5_SACIS|nr:Hypothetical Protein SiL_0876 [Sulfolobus islandicus LAL14/1]
MYNVLFSTIPRSYRLVKNPINLFKFPIPFILITPILLRFSARSQINFSSLSYKDFITSTSVFPSHSTISSNFDFIVGLTFLIL